MVCECWVDLYDCVVVVWGYLCECGMCVVYVVEVGDGCYVCIVFWWDGVEWCEYGYYCVVDLYVEWFEFVFDLFGCCVECSCIVDVDGNW